MEYLLYVVIAVVSGLAFYANRLPEQNNQGLEPQVQEEKELKPRVVTFPDGEVLTVPAGVVIPETSNWTPPMREIFCLIVKDRKGWIKETIGMDGNVLYIHKVFGYQITPVVFRDHSLCGVGQAGISWKLKADILDGYRALEVMALAEEYLNIKYSDKRKRIFNIRCLRLDRINREKEQQQLLLKQKEADKINEYLATLKKKG